MMSFFSSPLFSILSLAAILVGSRDHRTQFWKGAIQESFQQSLVEIGSVVSEKKIFFKFHPPFFLICIIGQIEKRGDEILIVHCCFSVSQNELKF
jgi:UV DNA damage repair endonuclease